AAQCVSTTYRQLCTAEGQWGSTSPCEFACVGGACGGECVPGARQCVDKQRQECDLSGQWQDFGEPCDFVCSEGACTGVCQPGSTQCASTSEEQTCTDRGVWGPARVCAPGEEAGTTCENHQCCPEVTGETFDC